MTEDIDYLKRCQKTADQVLALIFSQKDRKIWLAYYVDHKPFDEIKNRFGFKHNIQVLSAVKKLEMKVIHFRELLKRKKILND